jgi:putative ABC transport system permease protein
VILIIDTLIINQQMDYMKHRSLGFSKEQKLILPFRQRIELRNKSESIKHELMQKDGITSVAITSDVPGESLNRWDTQLLGRQEGSYVLNYMSVEPDFLHEYHLHLIAGRNFNLKQQSDQETAFILNRAATQIMGWPSPEAALGERLSGDTTGVIIGVVEDFHYEGLQTLIKPLTLKWNPHHYRNITVTFQEDRISDVLKAAEQVWTHYNPSYPFEYYFLDDAFDQKYQSEEATGRLFTLSLIHI